MVLLIRIVLIGLIIYLLIRSFSRYRDERENEEAGREKMNKSRVPGKKISGHVGDYVDYEDVDRKNQ